MRFHQHILSQTDGELKFSFMLTFYMFLWWQFHKSRSDYWQKDCLPKQYKTNPGQHYIVLPNWSMPVPLHMLRKSIHVACAVPLKPDNVTSLTMCKYEVNSCKLPRDIYTSVTMIVKYWRIFSAGKWLRGEWCNLCTSSLNVSLLFSNLFQNTICNNLAEFHTILTKNNKQNGGCRSHCMRSGIVWTHLMKKDHSNQYWNMSIVIVCASGRIYCIRSIWF